MRRDARWALVLALALSAMAPSRARPEVRVFNLDRCSECHVATAVDDPAGADDDAAAAIMNDANQALVLDPQAMPPVLINGLPSPIRSTRAPSVSPYDFFAEVIELPPAIDPRTGLSGGSVHFFAPLLFGRLTVTDLLSNGAALIRASAIASGV